jgi:putative ATP-binding cassette transporter
VPHQEAKLVTRLVEGVVLDDATAGLDEATEKKVYAVLRERLPRSGVLSLSTRPTIAGYHVRSLTLKADAIAPSA